MNKDPFVFPTTPKCRVKYTKQGTLYATVIATPRSTGELQMAMLQRGVGLSQIHRDIQPIILRKDDHPSPAAHQVARYISAAEK